MIAVVDYGVNNLKSVVRALAAGYEASSVGFLVAVAATEGVPRVNRGSVITVRLDQPLTVS